MTKITNFFKNLLYKNKNKNTDEYCSPKQHYYTAIKNSNFDEDTIQSFNNTIAMLYSGGHEELLKCISTCPIDKTFHPEFITRLDKEEMELLKVVAQNTIMLRNSTLWHKLLKDRV